jgi:xanthine dehydrogenase accessory factor
VGVRVSGDLLAELLAAQTSGQPVVLATVVATHRSVPRRAGSKMLVYADGRTSGTIGGGEMESRVVAAAIEAHADRRTQLLSFQLLDPATGDPGVCGGEVQIYVEPYVPTPTIYVIGCGHVGKAVVELAHWLGFRVVAVDDRAELATPEALPLADQVIAGSITKALALAPVTSETHVVLVTRNVAVDVALLPELVRTPARSIGVMGSKRRWVTTRDQVAAAGLSEADLGRITAPIGLELHAETPEEIAVSIVGEIVAMRRRPAVGDDA